MYHAWLGNPCHNHNHNCFTTFHKCFISARHRDKLHIQRLPWIWGVSFCGGWFANMSQFQQPWSFAITIFSLMNRLQGNCNFQSKSSHKPQPLNPVPRQLGVFATCFIQPGDPREAPGERSLTPTLMINAWNLKMMRIKKSHLRDISVWAKDWSIEALKGHFFPWFTYQVRLLAGCSNLPTAFSLRLQAPRHKLKRKVSASWSALPRRARRDSSTLRTRLTYKWALQPSQNEKMWQSLLLST